MTRPKPLRTVRSGLSRGIRHVYIRPRTPRLNGQVERSRRTDKQEFYQLLTYTGDVDLNAKLTQWENLYNYHRPHGAVEWRAGAADSARPSDRASSRPASL